VSCLFALALVLAAGGETGASSPGTTERVSVDSAGNPGNGSSDSPSISADGRYVAFQSDASNLVPGDTNGDADIFVHDRQTGDTTRVSVDSAGNQANGWSGKPSISGDGRYVAFMSAASNLVPDDTNGEGDVFLHDRQTGQTTRVGLNGAGAGDPSIAISADGRWVAFWSYSDLDPEYAGHSGLFVHDRSTGLTTLASVDNEGNPADGYSASWVSSISADGRFVAFDSRSPLVPPDTDGNFDIFVRDRASGQTTRVTVGPLSHDGQDSYAPSINADGRYVAFQNGSCCAGANVLVHDRMTQQTTEASVNGDGESSDWTSWQASISGDGRYVAFLSGATNLVPGDTNGDDDIFVHDRHTGLTERVSVDGSGNQANARSQHHAIGADGRYVAFRSAASNLVPGDGPSSWDIFVRDRCPDGSCVEPPPAPNRDIVFVRGIDSTGECDRADAWVESYLNSSTGKSFFANLRIGKYLHFNYAGGGSYDCPRSDPAYTQVDTCDGVAKAAGELKDLIDSQATAKVTIVTHSMGGLVSAYLVAKNQDWAKSHVASVVTFDGVLGGLSNPMEWGKTFNTACTGVGDVPATSLTEMAETHQVVRDAAGAAAYVPFYPLDATQMDILPLNIEYVPRDRATLDHDARPFHFANSCTQPGADQNTCEPPKPVDDDHSSVWGRRFDEHSENDKAFLVGCAAAVMSDCTLMTAPAEQGATTETHTTMPPDAKQARFISNFGSIVRMTLVAPDDTTYGPDGTGPVMAYTVDDVSETYLIDHPLAGDWIIQLYGADVPPEGEQVPLAVLVEQVEANPAAVGGIAELPGASDSPTPDYLALAGLATVAVMALAAGTWCARRWRAR
jgi:Tol biopolymer transport system component